MIHLENVLPTTDDELYFKHLALIVGLWILVTYVVAVSLATMAAMAV